MGFFSDIFGGNDPDKPNYVAPTLSKVELSDFKTALDKFNSQEINFEELQKTILSSANKYQNALNELSPGYKAGFDKTQEIAMSRAQGDVPADVANLISRTAAFKGLTSGVQGPARANVEARDLGLTSLDLQNSGVDMLSKLRGETRSLMPLQAMNLAFTPQQLRAEELTNQYYNNDVANRQAEWNAQVANMNSQASYEYDSKYGGSGLGAALGGLLGGGGGAGIGAALGTFAFPGIGTAAGAMIGGGLGMSAGSSLMGSYGGAKGMGMAGIFQGLGGATAGFGGLSAAYQNRGGYGGLSDYYMASLFDRTNVRSIG
ncbi:MAG: hypothetical protein EBU96_01120 [Actinobacteria bacterium]|nr:hypothetical protein [Actinomycetota bacterium]